MKIGILKETQPGERRALVIPQGVEQLVTLGATVEVEAGLGAGILLPDSAYQKAGATVSNDRKSIMATSDILLRLQKPKLAEVDHLKEGAIHISFLDPFHSVDLIEKFRVKGISAIGLEIIPRTTLAQKMDVLSSQANLAGYVAVILAAERLDKIFPMMMTPSGTLSPARVFIIGAGVAGLQAIATAKRLGARVDAFDTRPAVAEQIQSLGAKCVKVDLGETGQTKDGYAKALTDEQLAKQREVMAKQCALSDVVITTAQVFGRKAPTIITKEMVTGMAAGSVIVDLAIETGGNVEGALLDQEVNSNGVTIIGLGNVPGRVAVNASQMLSNNTLNLIKDFWNKETKQFEIKLENEIMAGALATHKGELISPTIKNITK